MSGDEYLMTREELNEAMIGIIYARVSTRQQEKDGTSLDTQVEECLELAERNGIHVPAENILKEQGSGADPMRALFLVFNEAIEKRRVDAAILYDTDRYAREPLYIEILAEICELAGVELYILKGTSGIGVDQNLLRYLEGYVAKKERIKTLSRTANGKMAVLRQGRPPLGWGLGIYGYDYSKDTKTRTINENEAFVVRKIFKNFVNGESYFQIAETLELEGIPTKQNKKWWGLTIRRMVRNQTYTGLDIYGQVRSYAVPGGKRKLQRRPEKEWIYVTGFTPPIIDKDLFDRAQERVAVEARTYSRRSEGRPRYWLSGYISCSKCGGAVSGTTLNRKYRYYQCRATKKTVGQPPTCNAKYIRANELEKAVWEKIVETLQNPQILILGLQDHIDLGQGLSKEIQDLEESIAALMAREQNLIHLMSIEGIDIGLVESELAPAGAQRRAQEGRLQQLQNILSNKRKFAKSMSQMRQYSLALHNNLESLDTDGKIRTLAAFNVKVTAVKGKFSIGVLVDPRA